MVRIQILPLPTVKAGDVERTPFAVILDQIADDEVWREVDIDVLRHETGAATVIAHTGTLDAPGQLELTDEQREQLLAYITVPRRMMLGADFPIDAMPADYGRLWCIPEPQAYVKPTTVDELPADEQWKHKTYEQRYTEVPRIIGVLNGSYPHLGRVRFEQSEDEAVTDVEILLEHDGHTIRGIIT